MQLIDSILVVLDHLKSDDPDYGRKVERLVNNTTIDIPNPGSDALLYACQRCGHRHTRAGYDDTSTANTRAGCTECGPTAGGTTHDDHRVIAVKEA